MYQRRDIIKIVVYCRLLVVWLSLTSKFCFLNEDKFLSSFHKTFTSDWGFAVTQSPKKKYMHKIKGSIYHVPSKHKKKEINKRKENKNVLSIQFISSKHKAPETQSHIIFESPSDHPLTYPVKSFRFFFFNTYRRIQEHKSVSNHHDS